MNDKLIESLKADPHIALSEVFAEHRSAIKRVVARRLDQRVCGRVDPSDIVQETLSEAFARLDEYLANPDVPFLKWLMFLADQQAKVAHRRHVRTQKRSIDREEHLGENAMLVLQQAIKSDSTDPGERVRRLEMHMRLKQAITKLSPDDEEIVRMRFIEERSIQDIANVLGLSSNAVAKRAVRSLQRLSQIASQLGIDDVTRQ